ncbi:pancreatic secretory granule membrane major glycoprotein GP2-like isoform X1 [Amblyraja radiata]|uniref:pancreatic secretory granule membrane major glycoprotein GP2-like isoform X1 n=2 Tax=Amblyraja radiata TaxID=386614 RepID=UPI001403F0F8|nr:pancreatic secretory granule membrane major glycoprotein GP2-like isoform X1 [Amblyraja radiata]
MQKKAGGCREWWTQPIHHGNSFLSTIENLQVLLKISLLLFCGVFVPVCCVDCDLDHCKNEGTCVVVDGINQCNCLHGLRGETCEDIKMEVKCEQTYIKVLIIKDYFDWKNVSMDSVQLAEDACKAAIEVVNGEEYYSISIHHNNYSSCGTVVLSNATHIMYMNGLETRHTTGIITRLPSETIDFTCVYHRERTVQLAFPIQPRTAVAVLHVQEGLVTVSMALYQSPKYETAYVELPVIPWLERLYISLKIEPGEQNFFVLTINDCWATPTKHPNDSPQYYLIKKGCPADETVQYHNQIGNETTANFSVQMFRFTKYPVVFLHCRTEICVPDSLEPCMSDCLSQSSLKTKRETHTDYKGLLTYGPIQWTHLKSHMPEVHKPNLVLATIPGIVVISSMVFLVLAITLAKVMRK